MAHIRVGGGVYLDQDGNQREIFVFSIASKRYALFTWIDGRLEIIGDWSSRRRSRHELGHLLAPGAPHLGTPDPNYLDAWWEHLLRLELGLPTVTPAWFGEAAAGRLPVTSASEEWAFRHYNDSRPYADRVRPFNFLMTFHTHQVVRAEHGIRSLVAPFDSDRRNWGTLAAIDRKSGTEFHVQTTDPHVSLAGRMPVQTYGDYFEEYRVHPELKLAGDDGRPCHPWTRWRLSPRHVVVSGIVRIGKTSGRVTRTKHPTRNPIEPSSIQILASAASAKPHWQIGGLGTVDRRASKGRIVAGSELLSRCREQQGRSLVSTPVTITAIVRDVSRDGLWGGPLV
jgi:hypothetical protein